MLPNQDSFPFTLPELPYHQGALAPYISQETVEFHYTKHHNTYVQKLNELVKDTPYQQMSLEQVMQASYDNKDAGIFNNAAQVWNHTFYWHSMSPAAEGMPGEFAECINRDFGSFDKFCSEFKTAALTQFGSGWAWLVQKDGKLAITKTGNADCPLMHSVRPLLTIDVWEHAYYLDYQNLRPKYIEVFLAKLANWSFAYSNMAM